MDSKSDLRLKAKNIRKNLNINILSSEICKQIRNMQIYQNSENVMLYYPMQYEINLLDLLKDDKNFYFPKVFKTELLVCPYTSDLKKSDLNIYEPCSAPVDAKILDLIFVPALMADKQNYRLGYGGGYYDRFLKSHPAVTGICVCYDECVTEKLPADEHDTPVSAIITQQHFYGGAFDVGR